MFIFLLTETTVGPTAADFTTESMDIGSTAGGGFPFNADIDSIDHNIY